MRVLEQNPGPRSLSRVKGAWDEPSPERKHNLVKWGRGSGLGSARPGSNPRSVAKPPFDVSLSARLVLSSADPQDHKVTGGKRW